MCAHMLTCVQILPPPGTHAASARLAWPSYIRPEPADPPNATVPCAVGFGRARRHARGDRGDRPSTPRTLSLTPHAAVTTLPPLPPPPPTRARTSLAAVRPPRSCVACIGRAHFCDRCDTAVRAAAATALPTWVSVRRADVRFGEAVAISIELCAATFWRCDGGSGGGGGDAVTAARGVSDNVHATLCRSHRSPRANFHTWPKPTANGTTPVERQPEPAEQGINSGEPAWRTRWCRLEAHRTRTNHKG
jgi:hypothetical protein